MEKARVCHYPKSWRFIRVLKLSYNSPNQSHKQHSALHDFEQTRRKLRHNLQTSKLALEKVKVQLCALQILIEKVDDISTKIIQVKETVGEKEPGRQCKQQTRQRSSLVSDSTQAEWDPTDDAG
ncbi:hypothetical protein RRG08_006079 [Elysia crispata]|uniref:Uncharacterized protein n=1 Tax=Elysia crispata TaxID=231223 RepID=A0AAE1CUR4_9GAST|nr:hypothetical protein RRG08_006079 [Elysia crispata]